MDRSRRTQKQVRDLSKVSRGQKNTSAIGHTHGLTVITITAAGNVAATNSASVTADCGSGYVAVGVSCQCTGTAANTRMAAATIATTTVTCTYYNNSASQQSITAKARCLKTASDADA